MAFYCSSLIRIYIPSSVSIIILWLKSITRWLDNFLKFFTSLFSTSRINIEYSIQINTLFLMIFETFFQYFLSTIKAWTCLNRFFVFNRDFYLFLKMIILNVIVLFFFYFINDFFIQKVGNFKSFLWSIS